MSENQNVRQPTKDEYFLIAQFLRDNNYEVFDDDLSKADRRAYLLANRDDVAALQDISIAVFPSYACDCVGYQGKVFVIVWGATPETVTVLIEENERLSRVHEHLG
jgi:hypothetical protein|tara:strand:+ start:1515 stop:1832 length:318 start_codon:yes stop_codon:yes gene_type:complete